MELEDAGSSGQLGMAAMLICGLRSRHLTAKTREKGGSARAWPVAAPMLKSGSF